MSAAEQHDPLVVAAAADGDIDYPFIPITDPDTQAKFRAAITTMVDVLGFGLFRLKPNSKHPFERKNLEADRLLTRDAAIAWRLKGGNLGINCGLSRLVAMDPENAAATGDVMAAGFTPLIRTANGQDQTNTEKYGGSHVWLRVPDGIDSVSLPTNGMRIRTVSGAPMDLCAGRRYVVAPTSLLDGRYYWPFAGEIPESIPEAPAYFFQHGLESPASIAAAAGRLAPRPVREQIELDARTQELNDRIDEIPWSQWLDGLDAVLVPTRDSDSCEGGCDVRHFVGASHDKSLTTHDRCGTNGNAGHWWSETAMLQLGADQATMSRLDVRALVAYGAITRETRKQAAADVGLDLGAGGADDREPLGSVFDADEMEALAATMEAAGDTQRAANMRLTAANMRQRAAEAQAEAVQNGEVFITEPMVGATAPQLHVIQGGGEAPRSTVADAVPPIGNIDGRPRLTVAPPINNFSAQAAPPPPPATNSGQRPEPAPEAPAAPSNSDSAQQTAKPLPNSEHGQEMVSPEDKHAAAMERAAALLDQADAPERLDAIFCTDTLREIRRRADVAMVSPMVALGANIQALLLAVPWYVRLPKVVTKRRAPLNLLIINVDESGGGKNGIASVDIAPYQYGYRWLDDPSAGLVTLPEPDNPGSGEAISGMYTHMETETDEVPDGNGGTRKERTRYPVHHAREAWCVWDEVTQVTTVRDRKGSTLESEIIKLINGEALGSTTKTNECKTPRDSYRGAVSIAAQLVTAALLLQNEFVGILQRMLFLSAVFRIAAEAASPEALAAGRRTADGKFQEPEDDEDLITIELPQWPENGLIVIDGPVAAIFEKHRAEHGQGIKVHPWDRHLLLIQLKVAAAGAIMHGSVEVDMGWWNWAGHIMEHHKLVRAAVVELKDLAMQVAAKIDGDKDAERLAAKEARQWQNGRDSILRFAKKKGRGVEFTAKQFGLNSSGFPKANAADLCLSLVESGDLVGRPGTAPNGVETTFYSLPA